MSTTSKFHRSPAPPNRSLWFDQTWCDRSSRRPSGSWTTPPFGRDPLPATAWGRPAPPCPCIPHRPPRSVPPESLRHRASSGSTPLASASRRAPPDHASGRHPETAVPSTRETDSPPRNSAAAKAAESVYTRLQWPGRALRSRTPAWTSSRSETPLVLSHRP